MTRAAEILLILAYAAWLLTSILVYTRRLENFIRRWDLLAFIPQWKFFAPLPGRGDYHLLFRDQLPDGSVTDWTELIVEERPWWAFVWNPGRRLRKAIFDVVKDLAVHSKINDILPIEGSMPFLSLLNHISELPRSVNHGLTQFMVMYTVAQEPDPEIMFISGLHSIAE